MRTKSFYAVAVGLVGLVFLVSLSLGESLIWPTQWFPMLWQGDNQNVSYQIIHDLRLPRVLNACLVGGTLACAGCAFQSLFRNALAEPYIIGASSGAALGVAIAIVLGLQSTVGGLSATAAMAMLGSLGVVLLVIAVGSAVGIRSTSTLLLTGIAISSLINAAVSALMILNDHRAVAVLAWVMGSLSSSHWDSVRVTAMIGIPSMLSIFAMARALDAFSLGDVVARSLGLQLWKFRFLVVVAASLATAAAVSAAGIVGFVGLVAPHISRQLVGQRHIHCVPLSVCAGAILMMSADAISRTIIAPSELPVGIVTALLGSPFFLWLLLSANRCPGRPREP